MAKSVESTGGARNVWAPDAARVPLLTIAAIAVVLILGVIVLHRRGMNLMDESYVLSLIANPDASRNGGEVYLFGFVLNPLFELVNEDVFAYRVLGTGLTALLSGYLAIEVGRFAERSRGAQFSASARAALALTAASVSTFVYTYNNRVLSYNSLTLCGLVLATSALAMIGRSRPRSGGTLLGFALWLVFVGKPTSFVGLGAVAVVATMLLSRSRRQVFVSGALAAVASVEVTLVLMKMSPADVLKYLGRGLQQSQLLGGHESMQVLFGLTGPDLVAFYIFGPLVAVPALLGLWAVFRLAQPARSIVVALSVVLLVSGGIFVWTFFTHRLANQGYGQHLRSLALVMPLLALTLLCVGRLGRARHLALASATRSNAAFVAVLLVMPYIYALGSNSPFTLAMAHASVFWVVACGFVVAKWHPFSNTGPHILAISLGVAVCLDAILLGTSFVDGPRSESLAASKVASRMAGSELLMPTDDARVLGELAQVRSRHGITRSTPVVDLTGLGPGYAFQLGGRPLGRAFFMGNFPGASDAARYALSLESCKDRASAWLLYAESNPLDVSEAFTEGKLDLAADYETITHFRPIQGPVTWRQLNVKVLRPLDVVGPKLGCP